ncbi:MAG: hypothetical protein KTR25_09520 [Myxococcales bacterium]|nr:hypothetical protein [Myxococcales bacterium]
MGTIIEVESHKEVQIPAIKMRIDFGEIFGILRSRAQITTHYSPESLHQQPEIAVVNFPPRQITPLHSEVLVLGAPNEEGEIILMGPDKPLTT